MSLTQITVYAGQTVNNYLKVGTMWTLGHHFVLKLHNFIFIYAEI